MMIADLHIHSRYSRATSRDCTPEQLDYWARRKGIHLIGTGDFTHPAWREELKDKLQPCGNGLYTLKDSLRIQDGSAAGEARAHFILSGEISSIYKKNGRVRKVHNVILLPGLEEAETLSLRLEAIGNLHSDGRPILGLDSRDLLEITLQACPEAVFIPAHIWTPHFSLFGAFSGFDTIEACFEDLTPYIHALETGLSSDPPMNRRLSALDAYTLVSNSDAHSPAKLGREANLLDTPLTYQAIAGALQGGKEKGFMGTIEFFPEEGKYHYDGHRNCKLCLTPAQAEAYGGKCPVCGGKLTTGVLHRVEQLADRERPVMPAHAGTFESLIPLPEIISACTGFGAASAKVTTRYQALLEGLGPEFFILRECPLEDIARLAGEGTAEGVRRVRQGRVDLSPGYDGEYGKIQLLSPEEIEAFSGQLSFFGQPSSARQKKKATAAKSRRSVESVQSSAPEMHETGDPLAGLNPEQRLAVTASEPAVCVIAGPGTGKTKTLVSRILYLVGHGGAKPKEMTAVTFTNKAAQEMRERLNAGFGRRQGAKAMAIGTFHSLCLHLLTEIQEPPVVADEDAALCLAKETIEETGLSLTPKKLLDIISKIKNGVTNEEVLPARALSLYDDKLRQHGVVDFDDLLLMVLERLETGAAFNRKAFTYLFVDEFQDINPLQYRLLRAWAKQSKGLFVIGDPCQSIYGFRGSDIHCFSWLLEDYPALRQIRLETNYRSTPQILRCALPVLANGNEGRTLKPIKEDGAPVRLIKVSGNFAQAVFIAKEINRMVGGIDMLDAQTQGGQKKGQRDMGFSDIAVLYRTHRQAELLEACLGKEGIPYLVAGRDKALSDPTVRGCLGFFRYLLEPRDTFSLQTYLQNCGEPEGQGDPASKDAAPLLEAYRLRAAKDAPRKLLECWMADHGVAVSQPMERLLHMAVCYRDMPAFLQAVTLGKEIDITRSGSKKLSADGVTLTTLHGAKGLEFPVVFLCGIDRGILPLEAPGLTVDFAEERRLLYVGMTRAQEELLLLTAQAPSPFLDDLPAQCYVSETCGENRENSGVQIRFSGF